MRSYKASFQYFILFLGFLVLPLGSTYAEDLKDKQVEEWLGAKEDLMPLAEEMKEKGMESFFKFRPLNLTGKGAPSYEKNLEMLKADHPDYYTRMTDIVIAYENNDDETPFTSAEQWAKLGDRIMLALYASNDHRSTAAIIQQRQEFEAKFSPMVLAFMPEESRQQIQDVIDMLKSMENVSANDRQVAEKYKTPLVFSLDHDVEETRQANDKE